MSLTTDLLDGLGVLTELPGSGSYGAGAIVAAGAAVVIGGAWWLANPYRADAGDTPVLTGTPTPRKVYRMTTRDVPVAAMDIPLDVVPRDGKGRTPYDIVGPSAIRMVVDQFYSKLHADPELCVFFGEDRVDIGRLKAHQAKFVGQLWGGPVHFPLEELAGAHAALHISPEQYWKVAGHLMVTLTHVGVPDWIAIFTMTRLYQVRDLIITPDAPEPEVSR
jgi:hemoglobin